MKILAHKRDTGLSDSYILDTESTSHGVIVTVWSMEKQVLGQFTNNRQEVKDDRLMDDVISYDDRFIEVLNYFNRR